MKKKILFAASGMIGGCCFWASIFTAVSASGPLDFILCGLLACACIVCFAYAAEKGDEK